MKSLRFGRCPKTPRPAEELRPKCGRIFSVGKRISGGRRQAFAAVVMARDGWTCQLCGAVAEEVDHIIPVALAPERQFDMTNARASCRRCNAKRSKRVV